MIEPMGFGEEHKDAGAPCIGGSGLVIGGGTDW